MNQHERATAAEGYEHSDIPPFAVLAGAAGLLLVLVIVFVAITIFEAAVTGIPPSLSRPKDLIQGLQAAPAPTPGFASASAWC